ncbi:sulfatase-like hydrolase/transferase, partial [Aphanothece microscopica]|uniref:sulfatase-like hydrolase/transferase n=1 Tax=Aphanothece microscopica TaxID=1049561 RepID=UPI003984D78D
HFSGAHYPYGFHRLAFGADDYRNAVSALESELPLNLKETPDRIDETYRDGEDRELLVRYKRIIQHLFHAGDFERIFQLYLDGIDHFLTSRFDVFMQNLSRRLRGRNVLFVIFGDHGEHWSPDSYGHHNSMREGVLRVPMLFIGPGIKPGREITSRI